MPTTAAAVLRELKRRAKVDGETGGTTTAGGPSSERALARRTRAATA